MNKRLKKKFIKELKATIIPKDSMLLIEFNIDKFSPETLQKFANSLRKVADKKRIEIAFYPQNVIKDTKVITNSKRKDEKRVCENCIYDYNEDEGENKCNPTKCRSEKLCCVNSNIKLEFNLTNGLILNCPCLNCQYEENRNHFISK